MECLWNAWKSCDHPGHSKGDWGKCLDSLLSLFLFFRRGLRGAGVPSLSTFPTPSCWVAFEVWSVFWVFLWPDLGQSVVSSEYNRSGLTWQGLLIRKNDRLGFSCEKITESAWKRWVAGAGRSKGDCFWCCLGVVRGCVERGLAQVVVWAEFGIGFQTKSS